jgi:hypothetical protein
MLRTRLARLRRDTLALGPVGIVLPGYGPSPGVSAATNVTEPSTRQAGLITPLVPLLILTALTVSPQVRATKIVATASLTRW